MAYGGRDDSLYQSLSSSFGSLQLDSNARKKMDDSRKPRLEKKHSSGGRAKHLPPTSSGGAISRFSAPSHRRPSARGEVTERPLFLRSQRNGPSDRNSSHTGRSSQKDVGNFRHSNVPRREQRSREPSSDRMSNSSERSNYRRNSQREVGTPRRGPSSRESSRDRTSNHTTSRGTRPRYPRETEAERDKRVANSLSLNDLSYTPQVKPSLPSRRNPWVSPKVETNEKLSPQYIGLLKTMGGDFLLKKLQENMTGFQLYIDSDIHYEHLLGILELALKLESLNHYSKQHLLMVILDSSYFLKNTRRYVENIIMYTQTSSRLQEAVKLLCTFFCKMMAYLPEKKLLSYKALLDMFYDVAVEVELWETLGPDVKACRDSLTERCNSYQQQSVSYKSLNVIPSHQDIFGEPTELNPNIIKGAFNDVEHYIDTHFKLLLEDYLSGLRNGVQLYLNDLKEKSKTINHEVFIYKDVQYQGVSLDDNPIKKVLHVFEVRGSFLEHVQWDSSKRLIHGSLLFISSDNFETFFTAILDERDHLRKEGKDFSLTISLVLTGKTVKLRKNSKYVMIESRVFFEPYYQVCTTLKSMDSHNFPLKKYIVSADIEPKPPKYLKTNEKYIIDNREISLNSLHSWPEAESLELNQSQVNALHAALTREFALIQGPPGTGKTYLGIKLINILLDNATSWGDGKTPIFVACYRNGAVDQILEALAAKRGTKHILRLGGRSSSQVLKDCTLKNTVGHRRDPIMFEAMNNLRDELRSIKEHINELQKLKSFVSESQGILDIKVLTKHLNETQRRFFSSPSAFENWLLSGHDDPYLDSEEEEEIESLLYEVQPTKGKNKRAIKSPMSSEHPFVFLALETLVNELKELDSHLENIGNMHKKHLHEIEEYPVLMLQFHDKYHLLRIIFHRLRKRSRKVDLTALEKKDLSNMKVSDRWLLYHHWSQQFLIACEEKIEELVNQHDVKLIDFLMKRDMNDGESIRGENVEVIGATTTGAARLNKLLSAAKPKIVVIEEAAEVLEAHNIASLTEHCEHLILIGDHKQLKPSPASHTSTYKYHLDMSLFERMINNGMEVFTLTEQHRMRPEISALVSPYIYKDLTNHPSVLSYPHFKGFRKNLFFLDHRVSEDINRDSDSHMNKFEAKFLLQLTKYVLLQGYQPSQITILTTYADQFFYIRQLVKDETKSTPDLADVAIQVVDNFQGEENDIILMSTVRSNSTSIGFLSRENRVCVALSRAKQGFILLGNMETLRKNSEVWKAMNSVLEEQGAIGEMLQLKCETHKRITQVNSTKDFMPLVHGGCSELCAMELSCGHFCDYPCHPVDLEHAKAFVCRQPCQRKRACGLHDCTDLCGVDCPRCNERYPAKLCCGHDGFKLCCGDMEPCHVDCSQLLPCGHSCPKKCHFNESILHSEIECTSACGKENKSCPLRHPCIKRCGEECGECAYDSLHKLDCGHVVKGICSDVTRNKCKVVEEKELLCGHSAPVECGTSLDKVKCIEVKKHTLACSHEVEAPCSTPKEDVTCNQEVERSLQCGHTIQVPCAESYGELRCTHPVDRLLGCGHVLKDAQCGDSLEDLVCQTEVQHKFEECGHSVNIMCGEKTPVCSFDVIIREACGHQRQVLCSEVKGLTVSKLGYNKCKEPCKEQLSCGHLCSGTCGLCMQGRVHVPCEALCGQLLLCGHRCSMECWNDFHRCSVKGKSSPCLNKCSHMSCRRSCGETCEKCRERCGWVCKHKQCTKECWEVCDRTACDFPCPQLLPCGHSCFGLCGEPCPPVCLVCSGKIPDDPTNFRLVLLDCGHVTSHKRLLNLMENNVGLIRCEECSVPIVKCNILKAHNKKFFITYSKVLSSAVNIYNNRREICNEFVSNFRHLNGALQKRFKNQESLNNLLNILLKKALPIMQRKSNHGSRLELKSVLFICFYVTEVLRLGGKEYSKKSYQDNILKRINQLASYLILRKKRISPGEMIAFSRELARLKCIIDFFYLLTDPHCPQDIKTSSDYKSATAQMMTLKEFTEEREALSHKTLMSLKTNMLSNHQLISCETFMQNQADTFVRKYYPISFHSNNWIKCPNGHYFYQVKDFEIMCPACNGKKYLQHF